MSDEHERLLQLVPRRDEDYEPWGTCERWKEPDQCYGDCSSGCKWARWLEGNLGADWCVCTNPSSHRCGLLTFEHQGCQQFEYGPDRRLVERLAEALGDGQPPGTGVDWEAIAETAIAFLENEDRY